MRKKNLCPKATSVTIVFLYHFLLSYFVLRYLCLCCERGHEENKLKLLCASLLFRNTTFSFSHNLTRLFDIYCNSFVVYGNKLFILYCIASAFLKYEIGRNPYLVLLWKYGNFFLLYTYFGTQL